MILFSGDWHIQSTNFAQIDATVDELLRICKNKSITTFVHTGDLKHTRNPYDGRVANKVVEIAERFRAAKVNFYLNAGNHDKLSMDPNGVTWLPIIGACGVQTFERPGVIARAGYRLFFLPYMSMEETLAALEDFKQQKPTAKDSILIFHRALRNAKLNASRTYDNDDALPVQALNPASYAAVIGGDFHLQQNVAENVWYTGSPFCLSWGEANQRKGYLLLDDKGKVSSLASPLPGFWDADRDGFQAQKVWTGASVRIHVPIEAGVQNVGAKLRAATVKAEAEYPGAFINAVPETVSQVVTEDDVSVDSTDLESVGAWIDAATPESLQGHRDALLSYLMRHLEQASGSMRLANGVHFEKLVAKNVLSFEDVEIDYDTPGVRLISGINDDWDGRSNGSGKTTYIQLLAIALFGRTLKGQKATRLRRRDSKGESWLRLTMRLSDGRRAEIFRGRQPKGTELKIDGKVQGSGGDVETQREIELATGLTWDMRSALFIDQRDLSDLLTGTDADRKRILSAFLNLERFERALKTLKLERDRAEAAHAKAGHELDLLTREAETLRAALEVAEADAQAALVAAQEQLETLNTSAAKRRATLSAAQEAAGEAQDIYENLASQRAQAERKLERKRDEIGEIQRAITKYSKLKAGEACPTCLQPIDVRHARKHVAELTDQVRILEADIKAPEEEFADLNSAQIRARKKRDTTAQTAQAASSALSEVEGRIRQATANIKKLNTNRTAPEQITAKLRTVTKAIGKQKDATVATAHDLEFSRFSVRAFAKDGVPAFVAASLLPRLNKSAAYYSKLFTGGQINIEFSMKEDEVQIDVINEQGGEDRTDQSNGESRFASLIASFALRDLLTRVNLLIADEPGEGLDEVSARAFAGSLEDLTEQFPTIFVTTHNPFILSELSGASQVTIRKSGGISSIESNRSNRR